jgi:DNA excision repair protein ERCC-4
VTSFTVICDTREQAPYTFTTSGHQVESAGLTAGDYSIAGLADYVAIERKSLPDFVTCCGPERNRFKRELKRLRAYRFRGVVVEANVQEILNHEYRSAISPESVLGSLAGWSLRYECSFFLAGSREHGERLTLALLRNAHRQITELVEAVAPAVSKPQKELAP